MARQANKLTVRAVLAANESGLYSDGGGLYLAVARGGSKSWLYRFMLRRRCTAFDVRPLITATSNPPAMSLRMPKPS